MTAGHSKTRVTLTTAARPGAVAVLQLYGPGAGAEDVLFRITGRRDWELGRLRLVDIAGIDCGLAVLLRAGPDGVAQLMPHGGPRVVQSILEKLAEVDVLVDRETNPLALYPEADSPIQADALLAIALAASPAAIDVLLAQPGRWREAMKDGRSSDRDRLREDTRILDRLVDPPKVVVVGRPNVGKSTLTNRLLGRTVSLVADLPGTTRDWVGAVVELGGIRNAVAVRWLDTPGLRASGDGVEQRAIGLARQEIASADVLIAMRDPDQDWPAAGALPREPDLRVINKLDDNAGCTDRSGALAISALNGGGIDTLQQLIVEALGLHHVNEDVLWAFSDTLRHYSEDEDVDLSAYLASSIIEKS